MKQLIFISLLFLFNIIKANASSSLSFLEKDLLPSFKSLKSETNFYHYFHLNRANYPNSQASKTFSIKQRIYKSSNMFWDLDNHNKILSNSGPGLYLAIDPYSSSPEAAMYSGAIFGESMIELTFDKSTRYFNVTKPISLSEDTIKALQDENVLSNDQIAKLLRNNKFSLDTLKNMVDEDYLEFRKIVQDIFKHNNIVLIEYTWMSALQMLCNNQYNGSSMVYIGKPDSQQSILSHILIDWSTPHWISSLTKEENESYKRNIKLKKLLSDLKKIEKSYDNTSSSSLRKKLTDKAERKIMKDFGKDLVELANIREKLFNCH